ncbi:MAG TPA: hypothetical protein VIO64_22950 [Pseudobacteroides sp.]|uniref:hypothetical protein n=1 Tax=Pseudobacteroides sp. TaxID=1968840 RepID=UPI002F92350B
MEFKIILFEGTDSIKFGMTSKEIQSILKVTPTLFKKTTMDLYETEDYSNICHVYYEKGGKCAAFEFMKPSKVFLDNIQLIGEQAEKIEAIFEQFEDLQGDTMCFRSPKNDIGIYAPEGVVESVFIARKGYTLEQEELYMTLRASNNTNTLQQPLPLQSKADCIIELMRIYNKNRLVLREIINNVSNKNEFFIYKKSLLDNSLEYNSVYELLLQAGLSEAEKRKANKFMTTHNKLMEIIETAHELIEQGKAAEAKSLIGSEQVRIHTLFTEVVEAIDKEPNI